MITHLASLPAYKPYRSLLLRAWLTVLSYPTELQEMIEPEMKVSSQRPIMMSVKPVGRG